jgi:hypothetical protein
LNTFTLGKDSLSLFSKLPIEQITTLIIDNSVTNIPDDFFTENQYIQSVTFSYTIQSIGTNAFNGCSNLTSVTFDNSQQLSINTIGDYAFQGTSITSFQILNTVTLGQGSLSLFYKLPIEQITTLILDDSVTNVPDNFFNNQNIQSVTCAYTVQSIGQNAFNGCSILTSVTFDNSQPLSIKIGDAFQGTAINTIGDAFQGTDINTIGDGAFQGTSITSFYLPNSITSVGNYVFLNTPLNTVTLGQGPLSLILYNLLPFEQITTLIFDNSVTHVPNYIFQNFYALTDVSLNNSIPIGNYAFQNCVLQKITTSNVGDYVFQNCFQLNATYSGDIGLDAFQNCLSFSK